jgi:hypothetical protein
LIFYYAAQLVIIILTIHPNDRIFRQYLNRFGVLDWDYVFVAAACDRFFGGWAIASPGNLFANSPALLSMNF